MYKLLIADDESFIREGLKKIISWDEYGIDLIGEASDGLEVVEFVKSKQPDMVIIDIQMPNSSGLDAIKTLRDQGYDTKFIILSGYNNFDYVKEALKYNVENYLLKPVNTAELRDTVETILTRLEGSHPGRIKHQTDGSLAMTENVLNRLVKQNISMKEFRERAKILGLDLLSSELQIAIIQTASNYEGDSDGENEEESTVNQQIIEVIGGCLEGGIVFNDIDGYMVIIFKLSSTYRDNDIINSLNTIRDNVLGDVHKDIMITLGGIAKNFKTLHQSYEEAKEARYYSVVKSKKRVITYKQIEAYRSIQSGNLEFDHDQFESLLETLDVTKIHDYINELFVTASETDYINIGEIYNTVFEIIVILFKVIKKKYGNPNEIFNYADHIINEIMNKGTINELNEWLLESVEIGIRYIERLSKKNYSNNVQKMIVYVNNHYMNDISLKTLSQTMFFSPAYLGQLFRDETGELFTDYINNIRIEKAQKLLETTDEKVSEVGRMVGINNPNYFYTIFKKYRGLTPTEYRKSI